jgi:hypothetical protein
VFIGSSRSSTSSQTQQVDDNLIVANPAARARLPRISRVEMRYLTPLELEVLADTIAAPHRAFVTGVQSRGLECKGHRGKTRSLVTWAATAGIIFDRQPGRHHASFGGAIERPSVGVRRVLRCA